MHGMAKWLFNHLFLEGIQATLDHIPIYSACMSQCVQVIESVTALTVHPPFTCIISNGLLVLVVIQV